MPYSGLGLADRIALVTGSARGIGRALAIGLAEAGASVAVSDMPERVDQARSVQEEIEALGAKSATYELDVLDLADIRTTIDRMVSDFGRVDILVNNAGIRIHRPALEITEDEWDAVVDTNLKGVFFSAQAAARHMVGQGGGRIINISSDLSNLAVENRAAYCASKAGVTNLTRALALEWIRYGITVNAIGPGATATPGMLAADPRTAEGARRAMAGPTPLGRLMEPRELVGAAVYLASPSAAATTGHLMIVDGGGSIRL